MTGRAAPVAGVLTSLPWAVGLLCVGLAAVVWGGGRPLTARRARRLLTAGAEVVPPVLMSGAVVRWFGEWRGRFRPEWWCVPAGVLAAMLTASPVPLVLGGLAFPLVRRTRVSRARGRARTARTEAVIVLCGLLAGEVRAGCRPGVALLTAVRECGGLGPAHSAVVAAARFGGDVPAALRQAAGEPGAEGLVGLAACWRVAVDRGAGLAAGLERLERSLSVERDQRAELKAQLSGARATAVLLAGLPVFGLVMGTAFGADPLRVLLHTGAGLACLALGGVLEALGLWWALWLVRRAESGPAGERGRAR